jgi:hypothetical protein
MNGLLRRSAPMEEATPWPQMNPKSSGNTISLVLMAVIN